MPRSHSAVAETSGGPLPLSDGDPSNAPRDREVDNRAWLLQEGLRGFAHGALPRYFEVDPNGTSTSFTVRVAALPTLLVKKTGAASGSIRQHAAGDELTAVVAVSVGVLTQVEGAVAALTANSYYAVYALSDGVAGITLTIAPMATAAPALWPFRTALREQRYCGCFSTDSLGAPIPVRAANGRYTYPRWYDGTNDQVWSRGIAGNELLTLARVPWPVARTVRLAVRSVTGTAGASDASQTAVYLGLAVGMELSLVTDLLGRVTMHAIGGAATVGLAVVGYEEG